MSSRRRPRRGILATIRRTLYKGWVRLPRQRARVRVADLESRFRITNRKDFSHVAGSHFERAPLEAFLLLLRPADVVYDVGGHIGTWTMFLGQRVPDGSVHVFEPNESYRAGLTANVALNALRNVQLYGMAASDRNGEAEFGIMDRAADGRHSLLVGPAHRSVVTVETLRLDDAPSRLGVPEPDAVKIDVEGAEQLVVEGAGRLLREKIRVVFVEFHKNIPAEWRAEFVSERQNDGFVQVEAWTRGGGREMVLMRRRDEG